jgi:CMP-N,N'-diacetyllegionaminic acid synthase
MDSLLAVIPARGGSKGLARKNIFQINGRPLISWAIEAARSSEAIDHFILSSDDEEIMGIAADWGCDVPFRRPADISCDMSSSVDVLIHAVSQFPQYKYVVLLQPTSPLRSAKDIDDAFALMIQAEAPSCVSVCATSESPYLMHKMDNNGFLEEFLKPPQEYLRRQDLPTAYILNGAIYIARVDWLIEKRLLVNSETVGYIMPKRRSIDIDNSEDVEQFRLMLN